jgi:hypothetical protein
MAEWPGGVDKFEVSAAVETPQYAQNLADARLLCPQDAQATPATAACDVVAGDSSVDVPQRGQNLAPLLSNVAQFEQ